MSWSRDPTTGTGADRRRLSITGWLDSQLQFETDGTYTVAASYIARRVAVYHLIGEAQVMF
jgi:hypothetical protein